MHEAGRSLQIAQGPPGEQVKGGRRRGAERRRGGAVQDRSGGGAQSWGLLASGSLGSLARASWFASVSVVSTAASSSFFATVATARSTAAPPAMAAAGARRSPGPGLGLRGRPSLGFNPGPLPPPPPPLLLLFLLLLPPPLLLAGATAAASREPDSPCRLKTVTVSTLPALRESDIGWSGARAGAGAAAGTGAGAGAGAGAAASAAAASPGSAGSTGTAAESRLLLFVRNELPGRIAVQDDLDNTELPFFTLGKGRCHSRGVARNPEPLSDARLVGRPGDPHSRLPHLGRQRAAKGPRGRTGGWEGVWGRRSWSARSGSPGACQGSCSGDLALRFEIRF